MRLKLTIFTIFTFILLTINLGSWGITETSEARYAEISKEMLDNQDFVHPKLLGIYHYHKPPVTYQITTIGYKLFGVNEFGARFFLQIAIIIQMLLVFSITKLLFKDETLAFSAMLIYFSIPLVLISSRNLTTDAYLNTTVLASIYFWLNYKLKGFKKRDFYLFFIMLGLSFEIKGPVGWIFPVLFILNYKIVLKEKFKVQIHHILGFILCLIISFAWYIKVFNENHTLWNYFVEGQIVERISSKSYNRAKPFWFYLLTVPAIGLPWIWFLIHQNIKKIKSIKSSKSFEYILFLTIVSIFIVFSIFKTKLILYILPMFGFAAILTAKLLSNTKQKTLNIYNWIIAAVGFIFLLALVLINFFKTPYHFNLYYALAIAVTSILTIAFILKKQFEIQFLKTTYLGYALGCIILFSGTLVLKENQTNLNSTKEVVNYIKSELKDTQKIVVYNYLLPSAKFYFGKDIITLNNGHNTVQRETQFELNDNWKSYNIDLRTDIGKQQAQKVLKEHAVLIIRRKNKQSESIIPLKDNFRNSKDFGNWIIYY